MLDPFAAETYRLTKPGADDGERASQWRDLTRQVLALRRTHLLPLFRSGRSRPAEVFRRGETALTVVWHFRDGSLRADADFGAGVQFEVPESAPLFALHGGGGPKLRLWLVPA